MEMPVSDLSATNFPSVREKAVGSIIAFACGDAAGWPFEDRANAVGRHSRSESTFFTWKKRSGGRFRPHEETILAGEYSDDTQLMLCTARSILSGAHWLDLFTATELPTWSIYQRGAGGATLRAVDSWLLQTPPWSNRRTSSELRAYMDAGGNGAAMRIAPHVIAHLSGADFSACAIDILKNSITTHGHPRALIGAVLFGYALWLAFRQQSSWSYGGLIEAVISDSTQWSSSDYLRDLPKEWIDTAARTANRSYGDLWTSVASEVNEMLHVSHDLLTTQGALLDDKDVLARIGALDKKTNGAGTVTACAAIYFAARYAAEPFAGLLAAAVAERADTDTLAAMSAALLGSINGGAWLGRLSDEVQDARYLRAIAVRLLGNIVELHTPAPVSKTSLTRFTASLSDPEANVGRFPDGRPIKEITSVDVVSKSKATSIVMWRCRLADGQSVYVKRYEKKAAAVRETEQRTSLPSASPLTQQPLRTSELLDSITQEVWLLESDWRSFKFICAEDPQRVDVLNATAPAFFYRWQQLIYERMLLGITRLFDPPRHGSFENISLAMLAESLRRAPGAVHDRSLGVMLSDARAVADGCIQHSRKRIIHRDHHVHAMNAKTLPSPTLKLIDAALAHIRGIVAKAYELSGRGSISFDVPRPDGNVEALLRKLTNRRSQKHPELRSVITVESSREATFRCAFCGENMSFPYYPQGTLSPRMLARSHYDTCNGVIGCESIGIDIVDAAGEQIDSFSVDLKVPTRSTS